MVAHVALNTWPRHNKATFDQIFVSNKATETKRSDKLWRCELNRWDGQLSFQHAIVPQEGPWLQQANPVFISGLRHDAIARWDVDLATMSILAKVKFVSGKKLQILLAVGAYLFFRAQLFDGSDIMVFEDVDFYGLHRHSGRHGGDIMHEVESSDDLVGPVYVSFVQIGGIKESDWAFKIRDLKKREWIRWNQSPVSGLEDHGLEYFYDPCVHFNSSSSSE